MEVMKRADLKVDHFSFPIAIIVSFHPSQGGQYHQQLTQLLLGIKINIVALTVLEMTPQIHTLWLMRQVKPTFG